MGRGAHVLEDRLEVVGEGGEIGEDDVVELLFAHEALAGLGHELELGVV